MPAAGDWRALAHDALQSAASRLEKAEMATSASDRSSAFCLHVDSKR